MFDIGFAELAAIAVVALIALGPERLPRAARFAGLWVRRARAQWYSVKSEFERELAAEDLKRSVEEAKASMHKVQSQIRGIGDELHQQASEVRGQVQSSLQPAADTLSSLHADAPAPVSPATPPPAPPAASHEPHP